MDKIVRTVMLTRNKRGLLNVVRIARLAPDEMIEYSDNHEQDRIEYEEALLWIERYCNWHDQLLGKSKT